MADGKTHQQKKPQNMMPGSVGRDVNSVQSKSINGSPISLTIVIYLITEVQRTNDTYETQHSHCTAI